ncbi:MAG: single-stranded-DNA-specific exonuclease RecJ [Candidatus Magasanikbacteria bacterium RIFCSPLOWO2_02_FULL_44_11]|uniref:Single-stranded-DNA-specific exonuclease RecJ n=1 Tax=Candidatus Magasanikbacteria bacterium RIFCSPLOWO2_02_FULL_44_11 TaxID=1798689 RepID=A0A1F6N8R5_9BACT|nr:MAG: single-stranded-DNA-specific exonuclease RecJ [Candidatus Magasanikbacteria bacterium RIFCSPLOWO2_02_FULL_44_11]
MKKWIIQEAPSVDFIAAHPELPPIVVRLLWNRNMRTQEKIDEFLNPDYSTDIYDPFLFNDMEKAVTLIFDCLENNKKITVHGDYDADGVCAAAVIVTALKKLGAESVGIFLPHRETDGYGLNNRTVQLLKDNGTELIITCDCGISNTEEITLAKSLGLKVIVTDHHAMPATLPPADAIIHPIVPGEKYPDKTLAGGGVAFKLVQALLKRHHEKNPLLADGQTHEGFEKWLLDMVSISTVGDMVPLVGESRTLVSYGLTVLNKTRNIGLKKLMIEAGLFDKNNKPKRIFDTQTIGFQIAPRINAAGRINHANVAFQLLIAETEEEAGRLASELNQNNVDRQKLTEKLVTAARAQIKATGQKDNPILYAFGEDWGTGILGLIASRLKEEFFKPVLAMGMNGGTITGSGRSVPGFNMIETLKTMPEYFHKFGGHPQACGFSLKNKDLLEDFKKTLLVKAADGTKNIDLTPQIKIDAIVNLEEVDWKLYDLLQKFEPFGMANEEPLYGATNLTVIAVEPVGKDGVHLRILIKHNSHVVRKTIAFGFGNTDKHPSNWRELKPGTRIDLAFNVSVNEWNGNRELQLVVQDIRHPLFL